MSRLLKRAIIAFACGSALAFGWGLGCVADSQAHVGFATGFGLHSPHPLTPHIGRVYWTPGDTGGSYKAATTGATELDQFLAKPKRIKHKVEKARCAQLHGAYIARHGVTSPEPLKGFRGCRKYALDNGYWRTRNNDRVAPPSFNVVADISNQVTVQIHTALFPL